MHPLAHSSAELLEKRTAYVPVHITLEHKENDTEVGAMVGMIVGGDGHKFYSNQTQATNK